MIVIGSGHFGVFRVQALGGFPRVGDAVVDGADGERAACNLAHAADFGFAFHDLSSAAQRTYFRHEPPIHRVAMQGAAPRLRLLFEKPPQPCLS